MPKVTCPGSLRQKRGRWQWRVSIGGKRHSRTYDGNKNDAKQKALAEYHKLVKAHEREVAGLAGSMRMTELLVEWAGHPLQRKPGESWEAFEERRQKGEIDGQNLAPSTVRGYRGATARFKAFFKEKGNPSVEKVRPGHVKQYMSWRRIQKDVSARTLAKDRTVLYGVFEYAIMLELRESNPVTRVEAPKQDKRKPVILTPDEYERLLSACEDPMLKLYVLALGETGGRCDSEVLWLRWDDVQLNDGFLQIGLYRQTKSRKDRWVPMSPRLTEAMRDHFAAYRMKLYTREEKTKAGEVVVVTERSPWVFHHRQKDEKKPGKRSGKRLGKLRRGFQAALKRANLPPELHQHDLRHRRVTTWLAEGADVVLVRDAVGHADLRTTMGYTHLAREHLKKLFPTPNVAQDVAQPKAGTL